MSLLLEALKKAEKAKEEAQRRARGEAPAPELRLEPELAPAGKPVTTRAELPDIRQPLEILTDEIAKPAPAPEPPPAQGGAERATARKVFEAKFREPNPRLPFYVTLGLLGLCAFGTVLYFWYQLRPPPPLVNANPPRSGQEIAAAGMPAVVVKPAAMAMAAAPAPIPGLPAFNAAPAPRQAPAADSAVAARKPAPDSAPRAAVAQLNDLRAPAAPAVAQPRLPPQVHPKVDTGYAAYLAGDYVKARAEYQEALRDDGTNRDALLGLAALDVRSGRYEVAEAGYLRLLQWDPNDAHAQAGLIALRASRLDPLATESRVKSLLAADPAANVLHFTLGNQLAQQGRWSEAQQEYFKAFAADPENADFAYNLAVSLDHLRQSPLALEYYHRAIALAEKRPASFDLAAARHRASQLGN
jgi:tetratricopeptide (TPR) repeat protein